MRMAILHIDDGKVAVCPTRVTLHEGTDRAWVAFDDELKQIDESFEEALAELDAALASPERSEG